MRVEFFSRRATFNVIGPNLANRRRRRGTISGPRTGAYLFYFAYNSNIYSKLIDTLAPGATFESIAHLPEWKLAFTIPNGSC